MDRALRRTAWAGSLTIAAALGLLGCTPAADPEPSTSTAPSLIGPDETTDTTEATETPAPPPATVTPAPTLDPVEPEELSTAPRVETSDAAGQLDAVTAAEADGTDRLTFTFVDGEVPGYEVRYLDVLTRGGGDEPIVLEGSAVLSVTFTNSTPGAGGVIADGVVTNENYDLTVVRQVVLATNLGGTLVFGVGTTAQVPFSVTAGDGSLVVSFQHP